MWRAASGVRGAACSVRSAGCRIQDAGCKAAAGTVCPWRRTDGMTGKEFSFDYAGSGGWYWNRIDQIRKYLTIEII